MYTSGTASKPLATPVPPGTRLAWRWACPVRTRSASTATPQNDPHGRDQISQLTQGGPQDHDQRRCPDSRSESAQAVTRAAGYVRVSTMRQAEEGLSLEAQEQRVREYIKREGWDV